MNPTTVEELKKIQTENFAVELTDATKSHAEWLAVVRFGLPTLLENQNLLAEIVTREAQREAERLNKDRVTGLRQPSDCVVNILCELGLKLTLAR